MKSVEERFWEKVDKSGDCWLWTASLDTKGYGLFGVNRKLLKAHRVSYSFVNGAIPSGMQIDHRCRIKSCVNPEHLRVVTPGQNSQHRKCSDANSYTGVRGVCWHKHIKKYHAQISLNGRKIYIGYYDTVEEADLAVRAKRAEFFTHDDYEEWVKRND